MYASPDTPEEILGIITGLPFEIDRKIWDHAMERLKTHSHPDDKKTEKALIKANKEIFARHFDQLMKIRMKTITDFDVLRVKLERECRGRVNKQIGKSVRQNMYFYHKLLMNLKYEMKELIRQQHPDYTDAYRSNDTYQCGITKLYQISIFRNYLKMSIKFQKYQNFRV